MFKLPNPYTIDNQNERDEYLTNTLDTIYKNLNIESDYKKDKNEKTNPIEEIENILIELAKYENYYIRTQNKIKILPRIYLTIHFINEARKAIETLQEVTKDNKKISYYESNKNASIDDLISFYKNKLESKGEHKLSTIASKKEIIIKLFITQLKKDNPLSFNIFLYLYREGHNRKDTFLFKNKIKGEDRLLFDDLIDFFQVGHVTDTSIYKSTAIYIYELFKNTEIKKEELKNLIEKLFIYSFGIDKYTNFKNFTSDNYYMKNLVNNFIVLDTSKDKKNQQFKEFTPIFFNLLVKKSLIFKFKFIRKIIIKSLVNIHLNTIEKSLKEHFGKNPTIIFFMDFISVSNSK